LAIALAVAALIVGGHSSGFAAEASEQQREALLQQMLARPNDLDLAFEYAHLSADAGDYEGAISALERMLIYAPNTPRIQFELGVLYYRLGAYDVARSYFEQVLANPSVPPDVARQVKLYIQQLSLAADPPAFSASIFSAIRYETNANFGPGTQSITLNGIDFTLDSQSVGKPGWSALNIGTLHYSYDMKKQGDKIEFDFLAYSTAYFDSQLNDIDLDFFELTLGPSFNLKRLGWGQTRLYTYAIGDLAYLGYDTYFTAPGAGVRRTGRRTIISPCWHSAVRDSTSPRESQTSCGCSSSIQTPAKELPFPSPQRRLLPTAQVRPAYPRFIFSKAAWGPTTASARGTTTLKSRSKAHLRRQALPSGYRPAIWCSAREKISSPFWFWRSARKTRTNG